MMVRKLTFLLAASIFLIACYTLYTSLDASNTRKKAFFDRGKKDVDDLEDRLKRLEAEVNKNEQVINEIRQNVAKTVGEKILPSYNRKPFAERTGAVSNKKINPLPELHSKLNANLTGDVCRFAVEHRKTSSDVQMLDIYELLKFDNPDGGAWKQGWDIAYDKDEIERAPELLIYVIPHSHTDPGWIKTFDRYYQEQTKNILSNMVQKLTAEPRMKFIYAEMSFFERWWNDVDDSQRRAVKKLLSNGQFEIVTGAWVMTDEANAHYFAMIDEMIEGHQWLENHLEYKPKNHWSIDPFGLTSTLTYLLKLANFTSMAVQRVHYSIKKHFAKEKTLEFMWRQLWSADDKTDIFCHMFPFYSYDVPHTCGPDPKICCQFDFRRLPGQGVTCPWHVPPAIITRENVEYRASLLLDQYRKKAQLYRTNVLLVPLGDDFRYDTGDEWDNQYSNYRNLFDYMNSKKEWNVKAQFGTLGDYFNAVYERTKTVPGHKPKDFSVLSGDFFTYADRDDHYWSGYYTSRPFYKRMDRYLQHHLRGAEILYSFALATKENLKIERFPSTNLFSALVAARRNLAIFQHHDGVTGTAKDHVMVDYGQRMLEAISNCRQVIAASLQLLMAENKTGVREFDLDALTLNFDDRIPKYDSVAEKVIMNLDASKPKKIIVYNSLAQIRKEIVCVHVDTTNVDVTNDQGISLAIQIGPVVFKDLRRMEVSSTVFEACWSAKIQALGTSVYLLKRTETAANERLAIIKGNSEMSQSGHQKGFQFEEIKDSTFTLTTPFYETIFDSQTGYLQKLKLPGQQDAIDANLEFAKYGTTSNRDRSGAYLFLPDGPATKIPADNNRVLVVDGPLFASVHVVLPQVKHTVVLSKIESVDSQGIKISNLVDISEESNYELVMRLKSGVKNADRTFFTDLNGLQIIKRKYFDKLTLQGNVYPMASSAFIEDDTFRLSLLSAQPLGVASMDVGWLEVFLDRRLMQDDNRGLFQPVTDNKVTPDHFRLVLEAVNGPSSGKRTDQRIGYHTLAAHYASLFLLYPPFLLYQRDTNSDALKEFTGTKTPLPCDVHLINLRTLEEAQDYSGKRLNENESRNVVVKPRTQQALILFRFAVDCSANTAVKLPCHTTDGRVSLSNLFSEWSAREAEETSLTLMHTKGRLTSDDVTLEPMDIRTYRVRLK